MNNPRFFILGGYGNTGLPLARLLLQETEAHLVLAGRNLEKAEAAAAELNRSLAGERVQGLCADASDRKGLAQALRGCDLVVVASSTARYTSEVALAALEAGVDYLDVQFSTSKLRVLGALAERIEKEGRCFITDGGFHPGLPATLIRYAAQSLDVMQKARVGSVIKIDWKGLTLGEATVRELLEELNDYQMLVLKEGRWQKVGMFSLSEFVTMDFGGEFGKRYGAPMFLEELRSLPEKYPALREAGFYVGSFNWFVDWLVLPLALVALRVAPNRAMAPMGRLMRWGLDTFTRPPYGVVLKVEAEGEKDGQARTLEITLCHPDGYMFTAIPVAACLLQYLEGSIKRPGLVTQGNAVEPERLMKDMRRMGVAVQVREGGRAA